MTARPIIFSAPMVRALIDGRKTQTRRFPSIRGHRSISEFGRSTTDGYDWTFRDAHKRWHDLGHDDLMRRLRRQVGDRLWVRESFALGFDLDDHDMPIGDEPKPFFASTYDGRMWLDRDTDEWRDEPRWTPSIHMPRWASRLTLVVTGVRVQRLQEISEADAVAEGCWKGRATGRAYDSVTSLRLGGPGWVNARDWFADLWDSLHGTGAWDANPFVVAITFAVHKANIDAMEKAA